MLRGRSLGRFLVLALIGTTLLGMVFGLVASRSFGIYFLMTGLHGLHVIAGMGAISWVLIRTLRGDFSAEYSTPVDLVGLYWHLVDLVWIYLFPLLYLIH